MKQIQPQELELRISKQTPQPAPISCKLNHQYYSTLLFRKLVLGANTSFLIAALFVSVIQITSAHVPFNPEESKSLTQSGFKFSLLKHN